MSSRKIKIFVDAHCFDTEFQGTQTFIREIYTELLENYPLLDIYFGAYNTSNLVKAFPRLDPARVLPYRFHKPGILRLYYDIPRYLKKYSFDYAHFQNISGLRTGDCRHVVTLHDVLFNDFRSEFLPVYRQSRNLMFAKSIRNALIKTTVSAYSQQRIATWYNIPAAGIHVIPNAVSDSFPQQVNSTGKATNYIRETYKIENFILFVSRIEPRKNHLLLLEAFLELKLYEKGVSLVFVGKESIKVKALEERMKSLPPQIKKSVFFLSQVSQYDLVSFYTACRLFVYPSKAEGFGIPPLEAAAAKVPVLCSCTSSMADFSFFKPYTFDPHDKQDFKNKLQGMIDDPPGPRHLDEVIRQMNTQYSWKKSAGILFNLLQSNMST